MMVRVLLAAKITAVVLALCLMGSAPTAHADAKHTTTDRGDLQLAEPEDDCWRIGPWHEGAAYVNLSFTVTKEGTVRDPIAMKTVLCGITREEAEREGTGKKLTSEFEKAAIKAVLKFEYKPRIIDGEAVDVPGVETRITFKQESYRDETSDETED